jgi:hypothetical protein
MCHGLGGMSAGIVKHHPFVCQANVKSKEVVQAAPESAFDHIGWYIVATQSNAVFDTTQGEPAAAQCKVVNSDMVAVRFELKQERMKAPAGKCGLKSKVRPRLAQFTQPFEHDATSRHCNGLRLLTLAKAILEGRIKDGDTVTVGASKGQLVINGEAVAAAA